MKKEENVSLANLTTMKTGGISRYFFYVRNTEDIKNTIIFANKIKLPFFVLGGGSNVLAPDGLFNGVIIKMEIFRTEFNQLSTITTRVISDAAVVWDDLVSIAVERKLYGIENLSAIPGTVGASPIQNIGAYGAEVANSIVWVEVFNTETLQVHKIINSECYFGYRESFFKTQQGKKFIITRVAFDLKNKGILNINYPDVKNYFLIHKTKPTLKTVRESIIEIREGKLPNINKFGTAGSFFKNPIVELVKVKELEKKFPGIKYWNVDKKNVKVSAAWLLDNIGRCKDFRVGDASVYEKHSLILVNCGKASTNDILILAEMLTSCIKNKTGICLKREVNII